MATIREILEKELTDERVEQIVHWTTHTREFSQTFTDTFLSWQNVEAEMFLLFNLLVPCKNPNLTSAAFHAVMSLDTRIAMISSAVAVKMKSDVYEELRQRWSTLADDIRKTSRKRNYLAHFSLHEHTDTSGTPWLRLRPSIYDARPSQKDYGIKELNEFRADFAALVVRLKAFFNDVAKNVPR